MTAVGKIASHMYWAGNKILKKKFPLFTYLSKINIHIQIHIYKHINTTREEILTVATDYFQII